MNLQTLTVDEAAKAIGVNRNTIYTLIRADQFPHIHFGRKIRVPAIALERWLEEESRKGSQFMLGTQDGAA